MGGLSKAFEGLSASIHAGIHEFSEQQKVAAQTTAALKSTGHIAGVSAKQIDDLALSLSNLSGIDDEVIKSGENVLLAFTNIRNVVGKGNDIFTQATKVATDFAVRTGKSIPDAARLVGKALQDPVGKLSQLARAGVVFTVQQTTLIKSLVKTGHFMEAQKAVLEALRQRYEGAAKAAGETLPGKLSILRERFKDLAASGIGVVAPAVERATSALTDLVKQISEAQGTRAKIDVAVAGIKDLGKQLTAQIRDQLKRIDVKSLANEIGRVATNLFNGLRAAFDKVDWGQLGKSIVDGIATFLKNVRWKDLFVSVARLMATAAKSVGSLLLGIGKELGKQLLLGLLAGLRALGGVLEREALNISLAVLKALPNPSILGHHLIPGLNSLINTIEGKIDALKRQAAEASAAAQASAEQAAKGIARSRKAAGAETTEKGATAPTKVAPAQAPTVPGVPTPKQVKQAASAAVLAVKAETARIVAATKRELARQQAQQFRALGLSTSGGEIIPGVKNLRKQLQQLAANPLTDKVKAQLVRVQKILTGQFGKVTEATRSAINDLFQTIRDGFDEGAKKIKPRAPIDTQKLFSQLGLDPRKIKVLQQGIARIPAPSFASAGGSEAAARHAFFVENHIELSIDGQRVETTVTRRQQKRQDRNPPQRRG